MSNFFSRETKYSHKNTYRSPFYSIPFQQQKKSQTTHQTKLFKMHTSTKYTHNTSLHTTINSFSISSSSKKNYQNHLKIFQKKKRYIHSVWLIHSSSSFFLQTFYFFHSLSPSSRMAYFHTRKNTYISLLVHDCIVAHLRIFFLFHYLLWLLLAPFFESLFEVKKTKSVSFFFFKCIIFSFKRFYSFFIINARNK